jgi:hypothetical protein
MTLEKYVITGTCIDAYLTLPKRRVASYIAWPIMSCGRSSDEFPPFVLDIHPSRYHSGEAAVKDVKAGDAFTLRPFESTFQVQADTAGPPCAVEIMLERSVRCLPPSVCYNPCKVIFAGGGRGIIRGPHE